MHLYPLARRGPNLIVSKSLLGLPLCYAIEHIHLFVALSITCEGFARSLLLQGARPKLAFRLLLPHLFNEDSLYLVLPNLRKHLHADIDCGSHFLAIFGLLLSNLMGIKFWKLDNVLGANQLQIIAAVNPSCSFEELLTSVIASCRLADARVQIYMHLA